MKNLKRTGQYTIVAGLFILFAYACTTKSWDDHYVKPDYIQQGSIVNYLAGKPGYSEFTSLLKKTGQDSLLSQGGSCTVFAVKNGAFTSVDTTSDMLKLKKIIGMHVIPVTLFKEKMNSGFILSLSGMPLRFSNESGSTKVNQITITDSGTRVLNGMVYDVENLIIPLPNILDYVMSNPDYIYLKQLIDSSYTKIIDPEKNLILGYSNVGQPIYKTPYIYKLTSSFQSLINNISNENVLSTMFVPSAEVMNNFYSGMLAARDGRMDLMLPKLRSYHGDTTIGGSYFPRNASYPGDSTVLLNYLQDNIIVKGETANMESGINSFVNISGNTISVNQSDIVAGSARYASNGYIYTVNKITLPDIAYRRSFGFQSSPQLRDIGNKLVPNPDFYANFTSRNGFSITTISGVATFEFKMIGAEMDLTFPYVTKGNYNLSIRLVVPGSDFAANKQGYFEVFFNSILLSRFTNFVYNNSVDCKLFLGKVNVNSSGPVKITFRMSDLGQGNGSLLKMPQLYLDATN